MDAVERDRISLAVPYLNLPGTRLYYEVHGQGPPLVFAHGLGGNHLSWWQQVPAFSERRTCVVFAHRGFVPSISNDDPDRLPHSFGADLITLLDHLRLERVSLVAQSMGGWTALDLALRQPERLQALVMASTAGSLRHGVASQEEAPVVGVHPAVGTRMTAEQPALSHLYASIDALSSSAGLDKAILRRTLGEMATTSPEAVAQLSVPLLGISGAEDRVIPPTAVSRLCELVPDARFELVPDTGHSVYFERPAVFNRLVAEFLG